MNTIKLNTKVKVHFSERATKHVLYLLERINKVEWSGILFYSIKGSVKDIENFEVTVEYIYPMNMGSAAYTEFETDEKLVDFMMRNPESLDWKKGLIHSHNRMKAFFSGTDMSELSETAELYNYYLSIVTNNENEAVGKLAFVGKSAHKEVFECPDEDGKIYKKTISTPIKTLITYDCEIDFADVKLEKSPFSDRVEEIIDEAKKVSSKTESYYGAGKQLKAGYTSKKKDLANNFDDFQKEIDTDDVSDFASFWLGFGGLGAEDVSIEDAIMELVSNYKTYSDRVKYVTALIGNTPAIYQRMFAGCDGADDPEVMIEVFTEVRNLIANAVNGGEDPMEIAAWEATVNFIVINLNNFITKLRTIKKQ